MNKPLGLARRDFMGSARFCACLGGRGALVGVRGLREGSAGGAEFESDDGVRAALSIAVPLTGR